MLIAPRYPMLFTRRGASKLLCATTATMFLDLYSRPAEAAITGPYDGSPPGSGPSITEKQVESGTYDSGNGLTMQDSIVAIGTAIGLLIGETIAGISKVGPFANLGYSFAGALLGAGISYGGTVYYKEGAAGIGNAFVEPFFDAVQPGVGHIINRSWFNTSQNARLTRQTFAKPEVKLGWDGAMTLGATSLGISSSKRDALNKKMAEAYLKRWNPSQFNGAMRSAIVNGLAKNVFGVRQNEARSMYQKVRSGTIKVDGRRVTGLPI